MKLSLLRDDAFHARLASDTPDHHPPLARAPAASLPSCSSCPTRCCAPATSAEPLCLMQTLLHWRCASTLMAAQQTTAAAAAQQQQQVAQTAAAVSLRQRLQQQQWRQ